MAKRVSFDDGKWSLGKRKSFPVWKDKMVILNLLDRKDDQQLLTKDDQELLIIYP